MRPSVLRRTSLAIVLLGSGCAPRAHALVTAACPWCGTALAPPSTGPSGRIAPASEPGTPLEITGTVYRADGRTPLAGVVIHAFHANARGVYPARPGEAGDSPEHGYLRGWVRTDARGRYRFLTIRPAPLAGGDQPALINMTIAPPGGRELRIDPLTFDDDARVTVASHRAAAGGSGVVHPIADARGTLHVVRDIVLENVP